jgi:hypothetical protein
MTAGLTASDGKTIDFLSKTMSWKIEDELPGAELMLSDDGVPGIDPGGSQSGDVKTIRPGHTEDPIDLSVIIASVNGLPVIDECLEKLVNQRTTYRMEFVVADRCGGLVAELMKQKYPGIKWFHFPMDTSIPCLRASAIKAAEGRLVGVLEDHCLVEADWAERMIEAQKGPYAVVGGAVENAAFHKLSDWAYFFCEYSQAMNPLPAGKVQEVVGNNVTYKRELLENLRDLIEKGTWDSALHAEMRRCGIAFYCVPSIIVRHKMSAKLFWFISQKFHFARSFAGMRFAPSSRFKRALYAGGTILLPGILAKRIVSCVWKKRRYRLELILSLLYLHLLLLAWALGEAVGYVFGPGSSPAKVS